MNIPDSVLKNDEKAIFQLRALYRSHGYAQYKMSKFEEYDYYVRNKDFLVSDNIITFTDTNGRLMALKPDVTLSIIKNSSDTPELLEKVYYNENVYRISKGTQSFKEIMQVGLECIGAIDDYCIYEVLLLAAESLATISPDYVLDISHLDILSYLIDRTGISGEMRDKLVKCVGEKNLHGITAVCAEQNLDKAACDALKTLVSTYGAPETVLPVLHTLLDGTPAQGSLEQLSNVLALLQSAVPAISPRIDFSVIGDMNYYNGIVFKGFVNGIPTGILSGGQYDKLMGKLNRRSGAIGFAVYLDLLERLNTTETAFDVDTVILYDETSDFQALNDAVRMFSANGHSVLAQKSVPETLRYRQLLRLRERGVEILENHA